MRIKKDYFTCVKCGVEVRNAKDTPEGFLCNKCWKKTANMINLDTKKPVRTLEQALNKVYEVKGYLQKNGGIICNLSPPQILIGHKVKLVLAD